MEKMTKQKIVVLVQYDQPWKADLAKSKLDAYGIPCMISHSETAYLYPMVSSSVGSVQLSVFESDQARAKGVLEEEG